MRCWQKHLSLLGLAVALVYVTCSFLKEENEDRLASFLEGHSEFQIVSAMANITESGLLAIEDQAALKQCETEQGALRLTPHRIRADGFFISVLKKS